MDSETCLRMFVHDSSSRLGVSLSHMDYIVVRGSAFHRLRHCYEFPIYLGCTFFFLFFLSGYVHHNYIDVVSNLLWAELVWC